MNSTPVALRRLTTAGLVLGVVIASIGSPAGAAVPDSNTGRITGCRNTSTLELRVIDYQAGVRCRRGEQTLHWNNQGPAGPRGGMTRARNAASRRRWGTASQLVMEWYPWERRRPSWSRDRG